MKAAKKDYFREQMKVFDKWKTDITQAVQDYQAWLNENDLGNPETDLRIFEYLEAVKQDRLTIAFVAEFSRGKTELINSIFFADYQRRLLPSEAGRTTMCPTELFYDRDNDESYIQLLPIETRLEEKSITEFKQQPEHWTRIPLDTASADQMAEALKEVIKTKKVSVDQAEKLGLWSKELEPKNGQTPTEVEVPYWRHSLISFPHPLLTQGLAVLDTPGLNALGAEPELTLSMLPGAQAILFVLAADTGVTKSDMDMWQYHIKGFRKKENRGLVAALNKIDTLWDEMKDDATVESTIEAQRQATAAMLDIKANSVFPLSAQKALVGKIKQDQDLLKKSRLLELENYLANDIVPVKLRIIRETILSEVGTLINATRDDISSRLSHSRKQLKELQGLSGKNNDLVQHLMRKTREKQAAYNKNMEAFRAARQALNKQSEIMLNWLSMESFDKLVVKTRKDMVNSWTTAGLRQGMKTFFDGQQHAIQQVNKQVDQTYKLVQAIYKKFQDEHGLEITIPKALAVENFAAEVNKLYQDAEDFRTSPVTTMTEQSFVIKKFFISLVSAARNIFYKASQDADNWLKNILNPLAQQIQEHKQALDQHLETLCKINDSRDNLADKIKQLDDECRTLSKQLGVISKIHATLYAPLPFDPPPSQAKGSGEKKETMVANE